MTALTCSAIVSSHEGGNVTLSTKEQRRLMVLNHLGWGAISGSEAASLLGLSERLAPGSPRPPIPGDWHSRTHAANGQNRWVTKTDRITDQRHHRAAGGGMPRARIELATPQFSVV